MNAAPLAYPAYTSGLNNQKLALFGLFCEAAAQRRPLILPGIASFDAAHARHEIKPFQDVYDLERLQKFAAAFGLNLQSGPPQANITPQATFVTGAHRIAADARRGPAALDDFACQFFRHLTPRIAATSTFRTLQDIVFTQNRVTLAAQFRIENDWPPHCAAVAANSSELAENISPGPAGIAAKIKTTLPLDSRLIYVACDETNLPAPKADLRAAIHKQTGITAIWKSDILPPAELARLSTLEQCLLDFEMAVSAEKFAGISLSTFSNLINLEYFCRNRRPAENHFIYNIPGPNLARRWDNGAAFEFYKITNPLLRRQPLIPDSPADCLWPAALTAHISEFGDLTSETSPIPGIRRGPLAAGLRASPLHLIEGFSIAPLGNVPLPLEYRAHLPGGAKTPWLPPGHFAGTRGEKSPLTGFGARLTGPLALSHDCLCIASFAGHLPLVQTTNGTDGAMPDGARLEAMQVVIRRK